MEHREALLALRQFLSTQILGQEKLIERLLIALLADGHKDEVVARSGEQQIDFRSVSRVGQSDLGANTARIVELRQRTETLLGAASR